MTDTIDFKKTLDAYQRDAPPPGEPSGALVGSFSRRERPLLFLLLSCILRLRDPGVEIMIMYFDYYVAYIISRKSKFLLN